MGRKKSNRYAPKSWEHDSKYKSTHYVRIYDSLLNSPAWLTLSSSAKHQYIVLRLQYRDGINQTDGNGNAMIKCPYKDIQAAGIGSYTTISKNFVQLEALGFIKTINGGLHVANQYKFSDKWQEFGSIEEASEKIKGIEPQKHTKKQP